MVGVADGWAHEMVKVAQNESVFFLCCITLRCIVQLKLLCVGNKASETVVELWIPEQTLLSAEYTEHSNLKLLTNYVFLKIPLIKSSIFPFFHVF